MSYVVIGDADTTDLVIISVNRSSNVVTAHYTRNDTSEGEHSWQHHPSEGNILWTVAKVTQVFLDTGFRESQIVYDKSINETSQMIMLNHEIAKQTDTCEAALADSWGYGQPCSLPDNHKGLHKYERGDGFVILWGWENHYV